MEDEENAEDAAAASERDERDPALIVAVDGAEVTAEAATPVTAAGVIAGPGIVPLAEETDGCCIA